jgi:hypothetical protein
MPMIAVKLAKDVELLQDRPLVKRMLFIGIDFIYDFAHFVSSL